MTTNPFSFDDTDRVALWTIQERPNPDLVARLQKVCLWLRWAIEDLPAFDFYGRGGRLTDPEGALENARFYLGEAERLRPFVTVV
jgi:hypothetical protein